MNQPHKITLLDDNTRPKAPKLDRLAPHQRVPKQHLIAIHNHHRQNLELVARALELANQNSDKTKDAAQDAKEPLTQLSHNYQTFGALCGQECQFIHAHHSIEDAHMFPALNAKAKAFQTVVERLQKEHEVVHGLVMNMLFELDRLANAPDLKTIQSATQTFDDLRRVLLSHFNYEEESIGDALGFFEIGI